jgi:hypothetical protein
MLNEVLRERKNTTHYSSQGMVLLVLTALRDSEAHHTDTPK